MLLLLTLIGCPDPSQTDTKGGGDECPAAPTLAAPNTIGDTVVLETGAVGLIRSRPLALTVPDGGGAVSLTVTGAVEVVDGQGAPIAAVKEPPATVYARATGLGAGTITASYSNPDCPGDVVIQTLGISPAPLAGRPRVQAPGWETVESYWDTDDVYVGLDPARYADRVSLPYDVYLVRHRTTEEWAADASLGTLSASSTVTGEAFNQIDAWASPPLLSGELSTAYDVVLDFDGDGKLSPGDLIDGLDEDYAFVRIGDLGGVGPHAVEQEDISGGHFLGERIYWPTDIAAMDPRPLVVISHGNGHLYTWYDYIGQHLASWGYVVMAHENNTMPGPQTAATTTLTNTEYILENTEDILDGALDGRIDRTRIAWIGHSRGGEGVVMAYDRLFEGKFSSDQFDAEDIRVIASIAPTVFYQVDESDPHDRPYFLIAGTSDGDVTGGVDCDVCQFYRLWEAGTGDKMAAYVEGATHNDFNCCGTDPGEGPGLGPNQLDAAEVQLIAKSYFLAMARVWLDDDPTLRDVFKRAYSGFTPPGFAEGDAVALTWADDPLLGYPVFDNFQTESDEDVASSGGAITTDAEDVYEGRLKDGDMNMTWRGADPMNGMTHAYGTLDLAAGTTFSWSEGTAPTWEVAVVPALADASAYSWITFDVAQVSRHPNTVALAGPLAFGVTLVDQDGVASTVDFADQAMVPQPYQRQGSGSGAGWANEFVTVRVALHDFTVGSAIDLSRLAAVRFDFGADHGASTGAIGLDNVELSR